MADKPNHTIQVTHSVTELYTVEGASSSVDANTKLGMFMALTDAGADIPDELGVKLVKETKTVKHIGQAQRQIPDDDPRAAGAEAS